MQKGEQPSTSEFDLTSSWAWRPRSRLGNARFEVGNICFGSYMLIKFIPMWSYVFLFSYGDLATTDFLWKYRQKVPVLGQRQKVPVPGQRQTRPVRITICRRQQRSPHSRAPSNPPCADVRSSVTLALCQKSSHRGTDRKSPFRGTVEPALCGFSSSVTSALCQKSSHRGTDRKSPFRGTIEPALCEFQFFGYIGPVPKVLLWKHKSRK